MLAQYLRSEDITFDLRGKNKLEIIEGNLKHLYKNGRITNLKDAIRVVKNREQTRATGLENGIANSFMVPGHKERLDNANTTEDYYNILLERQKQL